jgi:hypothetical protein
MKTSLAKILWKKELIHWKRIGVMFKRFNKWISKLTFGVIVAILLCLVHIAFATMSTAWNGFLWVVARKDFKRNLQRMVLTV